MENIAVETRSLIKNYGSGSSTTKVLRGMDIHINSGEFVVIFGPSGSGKSTLLNIINGLEVPSSGEIIIDGVNITRMNDYDKAVFHQQKIGMVFQAYNLIPTLSVLQNITLPMVFSRTSKPERERKARSLLADFGLESLANRLPSEISGGQQQRVGIMRALIGNPPIIVADEPTGNLDSVATKNVMDLFKNLNQKFKNTLIIVTHDQSLFRYADRVIHILDGSVVKQTTHKSVSTASPKEVDSVYSKLMSKVKSTKDRRILRSLDVFLSSSQLHSFEELELTKTVEFLRKRLDGSIDKRELFILLDKPIENGGAGLYVQTAHHIADGFENMLELLS